MYYVYKGPTKVEECVCVFNLSLPFLPSAGLTVQVKDCMLFIPCSRHMA